MKYKNILIEAIMNLGDLVALTAIVPLIKKYNPEAKVTFLVKAGFDDLLNKVPSLDGYIVYVYKSGGGAQGIWHLAKQLRTRKFDCFISYDPRFRTELATFIANIPHRFTVGSVFGWNTKTYLFTKRVRFDDYDIDLHTTSATFVEATRRILGLDKVHEHYTPCVKDIRPCLNCLLGGDVRDITLSVATKSEKRSWPAINWSELINRLSEITDKYIILIGTKEDSTLSSKIIENVNDSSKIIDLCGKTSLDELINLLSHSELSINIDNGVGHLAAALKRPTITLFPTADPKRFIPVGPLSIAVQSKREINVSDVLRKVLSLKIPN